MFTFDAKKHIYTLDGKPMTGVTTILGVIAKPALVGWAAKETANWIRSHCDYDPNDDEEGNNIYRVYEKDLQEAVKAHNKKKTDAGSKGTDVHAEVEEYIKTCISAGGTAQFIVPNDEMLLKFIAWAVNNTVKFLASEQRVYSKEWFVAGTLDFSFEKDGKRFIGDLKTMKKVWDRTPFFQTAAYRKMSIEMGEAHYDGSCIVNISKEPGHELTDHWSYDFEGDQKAFEAALTLYRQLNNF